MGGRYVALQPTISATFITAKGKGGEFKRYSIIFVYELERNMILISETTTKNLETDKLCSSLLKALWDKLEMLLLNQIEKNLKQLHWWGVLCHKRDVLSKLLLSNVCSCVVNASGVLLLSSLLPLRVWDSVETCRTVSPSQGHQSVLAERERIILNGTIKAHSPIFTSLIS